MLARLKSRVSVPFGGMYILDLPEKGMVGRGTNFNNLLRTIRDWRHANAFPIGLEFEQEVERELCLKYDPECESTDPRIPPARFSITLDDVVKGTRVAGRFKLSGSELVSQEEAERRASICAQCGFNSSFKKPCTGICGVLKELVQSLIGHRKTKYDDRLRACRVCHCFTRSCVWVPIEILNQGLTETQQAQFSYAREQFGCWH